MNALRNMPFLLTLLFLTMLISVSCTTQSPIQATKENHSQAMLEGITAKNLNSSLLLAGQWLLNNQHTDGSLTYLYYPQEYRYATSNNMIRQFMATGTLAELFEYTSAESFRVSYGANMRHNFAAYYTEDRDLGYIEYGNEANLGASSIALMATLHSEDYLGQQSLLANTILELHNESSGKFRTFYFPQNRDNDNQYFYSGEAMLALMKLYAKTGNATYLNTAKQSFDFYSVYFEDKMNPAFVPWHTMADYYLYLETKNETYADYILGINDWLLTIQNKDCSNPRHLGRFYDPNHEDYGPPHASSDGVYVEGLSYAYRIAEMRNDNERMESYKEGMLLGSRSLLEMQFSPKEATERSDTAAVLGGFRTNTERQEIRVDNTQHAIMAILGVLHTLSEREIGAFADSADYGCAR
jgi:hypothetical protein